MRLNKQFKKDAHYFSEHLTAKLSEIRAYRTTIVEAPSGYGKTTALRAYYSRCIEEQLPAFWFAAEDEKAFDRKLIKLQRELESEKRVMENEKLYKKYFEIKTTPKRGTKVFVKQDIILKEKRYYGYFALMSNEAMDAMTVLEVYRNKDVVEKAFGNLKDRLNMRRTLVSSQQSLNGKMFTEFIALIYLSYIKKQMQEKNLFKTYTMQGLLDKIDVIECFEHPGQKLRVGEILEKQKQIYYDLGVEPPTSL